MAERFGLLQLRALLMCLLVAGFVIVSSQEVLPSKPSPPSPEPEIPADSPLPPPSQPEIPADSPSAASSPRTGSPSAAPSLAPFSSFLPPALPPPPITDTPVPSPSSFSEPEIPPVPSPSLSPYPAPSPAIPGDIKVSEMKMDSDGGGEAESLDGDMSGGEKIGMAIGVIMAAGAVVIGVLLYKKRRDNMRRSRYGLYHPGNLL